MRLVRNIVALALLAFWPVLTSHVLLQHWGVIHEIHAHHDDSDGSHEHGPDNHALADGDYLRGSSSTPAIKSLAPVSSNPVVRATLLALNFCIERDLWSGGRAPPGAAPTELSHTWQFSFRAALPARAPSHSS